MVNLNTSSRHTSSSQTPTLGNAVNASDICTYFGHTIRKALKKKPPQLCGIRCYRKSEEVNLLDVPSQFAPLHPLLGISPSKGKNKKLSFRMIQRLTRIPPNGCRLWLPKISYKGKKSPSSPIYPIIVVISYLNSLFRSASSAFSAVTVIVTAAPSSRRH
jgi:hypothetical protein